MGKYVIFIQLCMYMYVDRFACLKGK